MNDDIGLLYKRLEKLIELEGQLGAYDQIRKVVERVLR